MREKLEEEDLGATEMGQLLSQTETLLRDTFVKFAQLSSNSNIDNSNDARIQVIRMKYYSKVISHVDTRFCY